MAGVQFHTLTHLARILDEVPEGREAAAVLQGELAERGGIGKIDTVSPQAVAALKEALPHLERAMASPSPDLAEAFEKLKRIATLTGTSQTLSAVFSSSTLERARELGRPRVESPAVRTLERLMGPNGERDEGRTAPVFFMDGTRVHANGRSKLLEMFSKHFGSEVTQQELNAVFRVPQKEFRIAAVDSRLDLRGYLRIAGEIRKDAERVGYFGMSIPPVPPLGNPWAVKVEAISIVAKRVGIGSQLLARLALFLHGRGVHTMNADAMEDAGLFCVFNGFRLEKSLYEEIVHEFIADQKRLKVDLPMEHVRRLLDRDANLAELATFEWAGKRSGREFLQRRFTEKYLPVRFELSADKQSWLRLLSNLHRNDPDQKLAPNEWDGLSDATRQLLYSGVLFVGGNVPHFMSSDKDHAAHLMERLNNWAQPLSMYMDFNDAMLERMPESMKADIEAKRLAIQDVVKMIAADADSPLFSRFSDLISPGSEGVAGDTGTNRAFFIASTLLRMVGKGWLKIPSHLEDRLKELVARDYDNSDH